MVVIDGYNLLHAMGILPSDCRVGPRGLERARRRLVSLLIAALGDDVSQTRLVFDAAGAPSDAPTEEVHRGLRIVYAQGNRQADDLIEEMIQHDSSPRQLTVVSDDRRLRDAVRRRHGTTMECAAFLEELRRRRQPKRSTPDPEARRDRPPSEREIQRWLEEFEDHASRLPSTTPTLDESVDS
jgi:predicted RNA-binding protein with PIN domain